MNNTAHEIHLRLAYLLNEKDQVYATASQSHGRFAYPSCSRPDIGYGGGSASITAAPSAMRAAMSARRLVRLPR